ncbi:OsmC family protein [Histidinibacterium aquaticum]|uniref:OsmC family protein n=1 Tax=Histidinibacterium aquaticum TaxID=2613962 RepID=A0A5J5GNK4_9RHOB|nr:OsmC family protein [Histidinibacterium aquaticum]KAA9009720.1 OsmC family protein [Histidinibacterium aquaticum]
MIRKYGTANWQGTLKEGTGSVSTESGALKNVNYGFQKRFEGEPGSNPEEMLGAAHASCFAMALSLELGNAGYTADNIDAKTTVSLEQVDDGFAITKADISVTATVPGIDDAEFQKIAEATSKGCPVSKVLSCDIGLEAKLA